MSRLAEISDNIKGSGCDQCEGAAELLAVVNAAIVMWGNGNGLERAVRQLKFATEASGTKWHREKRQELVTSLEALT